VRLLCNLPLECFDERAAMRGVELCTFGPPDRMLVDGVHFPFDVAFDPSTGSWDELAAALPRGFRPDVLVLYWPDQEPLPAGLEHCPVPVVGVISDYNLSLPYLVGLWPFFDVLLCDRSGEDLFRRLSFADVRYWCQFAGNLNPVVQRERAPWLDRVRALGDTGTCVEVVGGVHGEAYGRFLNRCRIGWNRSIRGEMNLRAFEVPACGALLLMERSNLEVADFFVPGEQCVLYGDDDFETVVGELLGDRARCERIAAAGHRRVQEHRLGNRLAALTALLEQPGPGRPPSSEADRVLGRAIAMLPTWAEGPTIAAAALAAHELAPEDARTLNLLGMATLRWRGAEGGDAAWRLWHRALSMDPDYLPAATNLASLAQASGDAGLCSQVRREVDRRAATRAWSHLDGPTLPLGYTELAIERSLALQSAVRAGTPDLFAQSLAR
jgi:hypothetical protein